jgi:tetratricopeptide (TPR) repeat protein
VSVSCTGVEESGKNCCSGNAKSRGFSLDVHDVPDIYAELKSIFCHHMSRREFTPPVRDGDAPSKTRPSTAPSLQRPTSALASKATLETTFHLPAASGLPRRPASAFPPTAKPVSSGSALSNRPASALSTGRPSSALSTGRPSSALSACTSGGSSKHKPVLPLHIDEGVFQSQKYSVSSPAEVYAGMSLVEKDLETNLMVNFVLHGEVPAQPPPEMSMGFLEPRSQDSQGIQRKVAKCIRSAASMRARGEVEAALAEYTHMLKLYPHDYDIMCSLGTMLCRVGETGMAVKALAKACECRPSSAVAFYNLGCAHMHHFIRHPSKVPHDVRAAPALRAFDKCISIAPTSEAFAARAQCKRHAGDFMGATTDYSASKSAVSAFVLSKEVAPQLHQAWLHGSKLLASTIQIRKDAEKESERARRREATSEAERKQRVLKDLFVDPLKSLDVKALDDSSSDGDETPSAADAKKKDVEWASDSSSSDEEGRAVAAVVEEDYLSHYSSVESATAVSIDANVLLARSKAIEKLETSKPGAQASVKSISRIREVADSVVTVSDHESKLKQAAGATVSFRDVESPRSAQSAALVFAPSDTVKRFRARQRWLVCRQFMRSYGPVAIPAQRRSPRHTSKVMNMLKRFEFLNKCPPYVLQQIAQCVKTRTFDCGDVIIRQGSAGTSLFIILMGNVDVAVHFGEPKQAVLSLAKRVAGFAAGQAFGETAFTSAAPRSAFCVAASYVAAAELLKEDFDRIKKGRGARNFLHVAG